MSSWLQDEWTTTYPDLTLFDVLEANSGVQASASTCNNWVQLNSLSHPVLRDKAGGIGQTFGMQLSDVLVVDRNFKIVFKGQVVEKDQQSLLDALGQLK